MVVKLDQSRRRYLYTRIFGGSRFDTATGIACGHGKRLRDWQHVVSRFSRHDRQQNWDSLRAAGQTRAFLVKFDPGGEILFSDVLGNVGTTGQAVALVPDGGILVSGMSGAGLAASAGAYSVP